MRSSVDTTLVYMISLTRHIRKGDVSAAALALLVQLGFQSYVDGFGYLRKAVCFKCQDPDMRLSAIYQKIVEAYEFTIDQNQIEQAMLSAIKFAWENREAEDWDYFFSAKRMKKTTRPTIKEFVAQIGCVMELWCSYCEEVCHGAK